MPHFSRIGVERLRRNFRAAVIARREAKVCRRKTPFGHIVEALEAQVTRSHRYGKELSIYLCNVCGRWHLTSHPRVSP